MEPILCTCGETISDKYEEFKKKYSNPFNTGIDEVCKELNIEKICTRIQFLTILSEDDIKNIQSFTKIEK